MAQTVSYEISLALVLLSFILVTHSWTLRGVLEGQASATRVGLFGPLLALWVTTCVAETNRTPFDFAEGESELVSGFNVEYGAGGFALIFIAEYARILFLRFIRAALTLGRTGLTPAAACGMVLFGAGWVWLRATYPRYRYDKLIALA